MSCPGCGARETETVKVGVVRCAYCKSPVRFFGFPVRVSESVPPGEIRVVNLPDGHDAYWHSRAYNNVPSGFLSSVDVSSVWRKVQS